MVAVQHQDDGWQGLTPRQHELCRALATGRSNEQIAAELGISVSTVQNHLHAILKRLGLQRRGEVMAEYWRRVSAVSTERSP